jgi:Galactose oxidase, central domain
LYLIGGVSYDVIQQVCYLTPKDNDFVWGILTSQEQMLQRYGHTCDVYEDQLVIFGGQRGASNKKSRRIVLNDLWMYSPEKGQLKQILAKRCPDLRYGHCACVAGDYLVIYGGMNEMGEVLKDVAIMNLHQKKWLKVKINNSSKLDCCPPGICFSAMVSLFYKGRKKNGERDFFGKYTQNQNMDPFLPKHIREAEKDQDLVMEG